MIVLDRNHFSKLVGKFIPSVLAFFTTKEPDIKLIFTQKIREAKKDFPDGRVCALQIPLFEEITECPKGTISTDDILLIGQYRCLGKAKNTEIDKIKHFFKIIEHQAEIYSKISGRRNRKIQMILTHAPRTLTDQIVLNSVRNLYSWDASSQNIINPTILKKNTLYLRRKKPISKLKIYQNPAIQVPKSQISLKNISDIETLKSKKQNCRKRKINKQEISEVLPTSQKIRKSSKEDNELQKPASILAKHGGRNNSHRDFTVIQNLKNSNGLDKRFYNFKIEPINTNTINTQFSAKNGSNLFEARTNIMTEFNIQSAYNQPDGQYLPSYQETMFYKFCKEQNVIFQNFMNKTPIVNIPKTNPSIVDNRSTLNNKQNLS